MKHTKEYAQRYGKYPPVLKGTTMQTGLQNSEESKSTSRYVFTLESAAVS